MDVIADVARGLAGLHQRSPMAALATTRFLVTFTPITARGVAVTYAGLLAAPLRSLVDRTGGLVVYNLINHAGQPIEVDAATPRMRTIARMITYCAHSDIGGAEAAWDALVASATRWQVIETLAKLACYAAQLDAGMPMSELDHVDGDVR